MLQIVKYVHFKIKEKFKSFREAFRTFDKDFDGKLHFQEIVEGLENMGVTLDFDQFKIFYDFLDTDGDGSIDFHEFCKINLEKFNQ